MPGRKVTREQNLNGNEKTKKAYKREKREEKNYFLPPFAGAPPFFSSDLAGAAPFAGAASLPPFAGAAPFAASLPPFAGAAPFAGSAAATSSTTTGAATTFSPTSFGAATILPLTLITLTFRCEGVGSLWPAWRSASLIFSRYWGVE